jgi:hypothetical protein
MNTGRELSEVLDLVGTLDDSPGDDTPRERFRRYLRQKVTSVGILRDYVEECLRHKGNNYNRALQDLVNYVGHFLEFEVRFGRYQGVHGEIGFDGHWISSEAFHVVVEVKTSEAFAIKTPTLIGYVDALISQGDIPDWGHALGLYVLGRPDPEIQQLKHAIVAENNTDRLRIISVDSLLSLAELLAEYDIDHTDILSVIRPSGPSVDPLVGLMTTLVAEPGGGDIPEPTVSVPDESEVKGEDTATYWLTPVKSVPEQSAQECIETLVGKEGIYAFGERTPGRKHIKPGDWICFYATGGVGVIGHAQIASYPEEAPHPAVRRSERYPWVFDLKSPTLYLDNPTVVDADLRAKLDAFEDKDPGDQWAWFVQATRRISRHDFLVLTQQLDE